MCSTWARRTPVRASLGIAHCQVGFEGVSGQRVGGQSLGGVSCRLWYPAGGAGGPVGQVGDATFQREHIVVAEPDGEDRGRDSDLVGGTFGVEVVHQRVERGRGCRADPRQGRSRGVFGGSAVLGGERLAPAGPKGP